MNLNEPIRAQTAVDALYADAEHWHVNTGGETIHAKRIAGRWRTIKWLTASVWLIFFLGPYVRWDGRQAVLFDKSLAGSTTSSAPRSYPRTFGCCPCCCSSSPSCWAVRTHQLEGHVA